MADDVAPTPEQNAPEAAAASAGRGSLLSKLAVLAFVLGIVVVECLVAYLVIPSPTQTAAMAGVVPSQEVELDPLLPAEKEGEGVAEEQVEVDLGEFDVVSFQPASNTTLRIDFHLYGTIHPDDQEKFDLAWGENTHRVRDQVIVTVRGCELTELTDAGLGLIKRKILEKINRTLGKPLLQSIIFSEFSFIEQ